MEPLNKIPQHAGFWKRLASFIIDAIILAIVTVIIRAILLPAFPNRGAGFAFFLLFSGPICLIFGWVYYALMESSRVQATLGKMALGIKVTDMQEKRLSFGKSTGRYFAKILSAIILCIGFLMIIWTKKKQGLHDMLAKTLVVNK